MERRESIRVDYSGEWKINPHPGLLLVIDCLDGAGKGTQMEALASELRKRGARTFITNEPTAGPIGGQIRLALEHRIKLDSLSMQMAFSTDRGDHLFNENGLVSHLKDGKVVINDRYFWSTLAYGYALGLDMDWLTMLQLKFPIPDDSFYLDVPTDFCLERIQKSRLGRDLFETSEMLKKTAIGYKIILDKYGDQFEVIDGLQRPEEITKQMLAKVEKNPKFNSLCAKIAS